MEKTIELYVTILAILKAGAPYLPVTADTPKGRLATILETAGVDIIVTSNSLREGMDFTESMDVLVYEELDLSKLSERNPSVRVYPTHPAYILFTSGSTGTPKGVVLQHQSTVGNIKVLIDLYGGLEREAGVDMTGLEASMLQFCSQSFDVSVFEIFYTWAKGMVLTSGTKDVLLRDLPAVINNLQITHLSLTNTVASLLPADFPSVKFFVQAGEFLTEAVKRVWARPGVCAVNAYGPTETTNVCTATGVVNSQSRVDDLGKAFESVSVFIMENKEGSTKIMPRGAAGEIVCGGVQIVSS